MQKKSQPNDRSFHVRLPNSSISCMALCTSLTNALEVIFYNEMRYINLRFTYLLTYLSKTAGRPTSCSRDAEAVRGVTTNRMMSNKNKRGA